MKKCLLSALSVALCLALTGCFGMNKISDTLSPPKPSGELYKIQQTLEASVGHDVDLVYPSSGQYRSAIITRDIDSDGKYEVFSFYSTETDDKTTVMHINYIRWRDDKWVSVTDLQLDSSSVESVDFVRLDSSDIPKIVVSWERYSTTDKLLSVYSIDSGELVENTRTEYSVYSASDFDENGILEIVALSLDTEEKSAKATLLALGEKGFTEKSTCALDGSVTAYYKPTLSKLTNGKQALFIDADKGTGMITEVLYLEDGVLKNAFTYNSLNENVNTLRASAVRSGDYDRDGCVDIPLAHRLPLASTELNEDSAYMTIWNSFDGKTLTPIAHSIINYTDGYYFEMPENWLGNIAVERRLESRQRVFYRWDSTLQELGEEVLRIEAVKLSTWESNHDRYAGYFELARSSKDVFAVSFSNSALTPQADDFKEVFNVIKTEIDSNKIR